MKSSANTRFLVLKLTIVSSAILLMQMPGVYAAGLSIQYGNAHHGISIGHHNKHGAVGQVTINRHPSRHHSRHRSSNYSTAHHYQKKRYSYPAYSAYFSPSYSRYNAYSSPAQHYYNKGHSRSYINSSYPNSYRSHSYYQQSSPRYNGKQYYSENPWDALLQGQTHSALLQFGTEAQAYPKAGVPKIGYALAAAASGDLKQGVYAMRRAFKIDPESLNNYRFNQNLQPLINDVRGLYQYKLSHRGRHKDEAFMIAALSYLSGDQEGAQHNLERARHDGDRSRSFKNLRSVLGKTNYSDKMGSSKDY